MYFLLAVPPKFGLTCYGSGDSLGITYNCTLAEKVTSIQCFIDNQLKKNCMFNADNVTQQLSIIMSFPAISGSLPLHLLHDKYSVGIHAVAIVFETAAGSTKFETLYDIYGIHHFNIHSYSLYSL